jgi:hypothetical protein
VLGAGSIRPQPLTESFLLEAGAADNPPLIWAQAHAGRRDPKPPLAVLLSPRAVNPAGCF